MNSYTSPRNLWHDVLCNTMQEESPSPKFPSGNLAHEICESLNCLLIWFLARSIHNTSYVLDNCRHGWPEFWLPLHHQSSMSDIGAKNYQASSILIQPEQKWLTWIQRLIMSANRDNTFSEHCPRIEGSTILDRASMSWSWKPAHLTRCCSWRGRELYNFFQFSQQTCRWIRELFSYVTQRRKMKQLRKVHCEVKHESLNLLPIIGFTPSKKF